MKKIKAILKTVVLATLSYTAVVAQQPTKTKNISDNKQLDGTKLPEAAGWGKRKSGSREVGWGDAELREGAIRFGAKAGEQYILFVTGAGGGGKDQRETATKFEPTGNYTIEFSFKASPIEGRGINIHLRDGIGHWGFILRKGGIANWLAQPTSERNKIIVPANVAEYHTYRFAVNRENKTMHIYVDGIYKTTVTGEANDTGTKSSLEFGQSQTDKESYGWLKYVSYDLTDAYAPVVTN